MTGKISIIGQIAEIDREIQMREHVYPEQVRSGRMKPEAADMLMDRIRAIRATLVFCKDNEPEIRAFIASRKAGAQ